jgi:anti-sigma-K factor RskA
MNHPGHQSPGDLAAAYALDALTPDEARRFEAFLETSPESQREVAEFREVAALLTLGPPVCGIPTDVRDRVLARIHNETAWHLHTSPVHLPGYRTSMVMWVGLAASLIVAVGLGTAFLSLKREVALLERTVAERQQQRDGREATLNAILEPGVELYQLTASGDPDPGIQLFWDRGRNRAIVHGWRLKPVPEGRAYQLWFIKDGRPVPSVTFKPEPTGHVKLEGVAVPADGNVSAAAITIEPELGSLQPTVPILLAGTLLKS